MPTPPPETSRTLEDFERILRELSDAGASFTVIGGCAVGAYAHLMDEVVRSLDLDVLVTSGELSEILTWAPRDGVRIRSRPQPRSIPVAFVEWDGEEVNLLTRAAGIGDTEGVLSRSRHFELSPGGLEVPIADPNDLLRNKRAANRPKDQPHMEILRRFLHGEVVAAFADEVDPRLRLQPARRLMAAEELERLPRPLFEDILKQPLRSSDLPFLALRAPDDAGCEAVLSRSRDLVDGDMAEKLERIAAARRG